MENSLGINVKNVDPLLINVENVNKTPDFSISNQDVADLLLHTTNYLIENREKLIETYGGKTYGILLAKSMGCDIPQFFPIPTDFLSNNSNVVNPGDLKKFENLLSQLDDFFVQGIISDNIENNIKKITGCSRINLNTDDIELIFDGGSYVRKTKEYIKNLIIKDFLISNLPVLKHILNDLDDDNIFDRYSFLLDLYVEQLGWYSYEVYDYNGYDGLKKCIKIKSYEGDVIYDLGNNEDFIYGDISSYIREEIILGLGLLKYKTSEEINEEINKAYKLSTKSNDYGKIRGDIISEANIYNSRQLKNFLGVINENTNFSQEQIAYLEKVFSKFKNYPFISVRSSANIEDGGDNNNAGTFYTGFCNTSNFDDFLTEIKKVLASSKNSKNKNTKMGITVMAVLGNKDGDFYYPEGGGVMLTNSFGGRVSTSSEFGLPVGITAGTGKGFHHDFNADGSLAQARIQEYSTHNYERPESIKGFHSRTNSISEIRNYNLRAFTLKRLDNYKQIYGAFSIEIYEKLVKIGKDLETKLGYPLDIEFVVDDGKPYIIQLRPYTNKYKKPEGFKYPDLEGKEIILDDKSGETVYCMGYLKEDSLKVVELEKKLTDDGTDNRDPNKKYILDELNRLEKMGEPYLLYIEDNLSVFPEINKLEFPNFRGLAFLGNQTSIASHFSMMLRQNEIPTICISRGNHNLYLSDVDNVGVFIDGEKGESVIYK